MPTALEAAAALQQIVVEDSGEALSKARLQGLMYYARGLSLAMRGEPLFEGALSPTSFGFAAVDLTKAFASAPLPWWGTLVGTDPGTIADDALLNEVVQVFGGLNAQALANGIRSEAPWVTYGTRRGGDMDPTVLDTELADHFFEMLDDGRDVVGELGLVPYRDRPSWELPFRVAVNVKCLVDHPMFVEASSREWRRRLDLDDEPDADDASHDVSGSGMVAVAMR